MYRGVTLEMMVYLSAARPRITSCRTQDFLDISNPKAVLERLLRGFSALTKGDCICLNYNNKKYFIDVIESKPQVGSSC